MPIHDWTRVDAGTFHFFHLRWIASICDILNGGLLPRNYYAMGEQRAIGDEPDVLTLHAAPFGNLGGDDAGAAEPSGDAGGGLLLAPPRASIVDEADTDYYRRKQNSVVARHVSGDRIVAMIEIVSWGNKSTRLALEQFVKKARFLDRGVHLLITDIQPPGPCDPQGIQGVIWDYVAGKTYSAPIDKPLTVAAYESDVVFRAYVEPVAGGDSLPDMPLFLRPGQHVNIPLEATYQTTWRVFPQRWKEVIAPGR
jgi:hypothetical protein